MPRLRWFGRVLIVVASLATAIASSVQAAEIPPNLRPPGSAVDQVLREILLSSIPEDYEETKDWGGTKEITLGGHFRTSGGKIWWEKRKKEVNHGQWRRYRIWLDEPAKHLQVQVLDFRRLGDSRWAFEARLKTRLKTFARHTQWQRGVQMYSISVDADADVEVRVRCEVAFRVVSKGYFLAVAVEPRVTHLDLDLHRFHIDRISKVGGFVADEIGDGLKDTIGRKLDRREAHIVGKLNASIAKRADRLVFSPEDFAKSSWGRLRESGE